MKHTDDAYAAMLLTLALSPNKEEYVRPFSVLEFRRFEEAARASRYHSIGQLMDVDISGMMLYMGLSEEEAYRAHTLLHRNVTLSYALEGYMMEGLDIVTQYDDEYPRRLERKLGAFAPPCIYRCGDPEILNRPTLAVMGISGVRTTAEVREAIEKLVRGAAERGYVVATGGELGVSRVAQGAVLEQSGGALLDILGGGMHDHLREDAIAALVGQHRCTVLSTEHPDAMFTVSHAIARNKLLFALADAAFIFSTDGHRGELDALQNRTCDWIYAWTGHPGNGPLIARGARPLKGPESIDLDEMCRHWASSRAEQVSFFDLM